MPKDQLIQGGVILTMRFSFDNR